uniref:Uncharacterized protein n=1 Tax=Arundo donax TaxID=35708 RepID=A0A0A8Z828_ARUDO
MVGCKFCWALGAGAIALVNLVALLLPGP